MGIWHPCDGYVDYAFSPYSRLQTIPQTNSSTQPLPVLWCTSLPHALLTGFPFPNGSQNFFPLH